MPLLPALRLALWLLVGGAAAYLLFALASVLAFRPPRPLGKSPRPRTIVLRPLCGDEHGLDLALESLLAQEVSDEFRFVFGVDSGRDPALIVARTVAARHPNRRVEFVIDPRKHGANHKVSNLINMATCGLDEIVVLSDSDVILPPGSLQALVDATSPAEVGAVTSLYRGRPGDDSSLVQRLGALYLDGWFLPTALLHARIAPASVCYGQLTAIKREVLESCGGLEALADSLADDTELGHFARRAGRKIVFAPHVVEVWVNDASLRALFSHEVRWARTIRALHPLGYFASIFMHPGPLPLLLTIVDPSVPAWLSVLGLGLLRWVLVWTTHARFGCAAGLKRANPLTLVVRGQLYFAVWVVGFFGSKIRWRGRELRVGPNATVEQARERPASLATLSER